MKLFSNKIFNKHYSKMKKNIAFILLFSIVTSFLFVKNNFAVRRLWPAKMNLYNDTLNLDHFIATDSIVKDSKKGLLFTGDPRELFTLGCGQIAINMTLSGMGHQYIQFLEGLKKRNIKITMIVVNDKPSVEMDFSKAPEMFKNPFFYLLDFSSSSGEWQRWNFERVVEDYGELVDNWVIGNEINSQLYSYYGPSSMEDFTTKFLDTFKIMYEMIKEKNEDANVYMSFDQAWDLPRLDPYSKKFQVEEGSFHYNMKSQLEFINKYLPKDMDWGVSLHPYPSPVEHGYFWDDEEATLNPKKAGDEKPYLITLKNFDIAIELLAEPRFLTKDKKVRNIIISEFGVTANQGEDVQAAGIYYLWEKIRDNPFIKAFHYNAQTYLEDGFNLSLVNKNGRKRLAWVVFKDMDRQDESRWCKDLLDTVLEKHGYKDNLGIIEEIKKESEKETKSKIIWSRD